MAAAQARWGNLLLNQAKTSLVDIRNVRVFRVEAGGYDCKTGVRLPWSINAYYNRTNLETLATYHDEDQAKEVFTDLCAVLWNGEISDYTLPTDPKGTPAK